MFDEEIKYINIFIGNNKFEKMDYQLSENKNDIYDIVVDYVKELIKNIKQIDLEDISIITIKEFKSKSGFFPYTFPFKNPEIDTIKCFQILTGKLPIAQNVVIYNENTVSE